AVPYEELVTAPHNGFAVGADGHGRRRTIDFALPVRRGFVNRVVMNDALLLLAGIGSAATPGDEVLAVGGKGQGENLAGLRQMLAPWLTLHGIPDLHVAVNGPGGDELAIGTQRRRPF